MRQETIPITLLVPKEMLPVIDDFAKKKQWSRNKYIINALSKYFKWVDSTLDFNSDISQTG